MQYVDPRAFSSIFSTPGDRFDVILNTSLPIGNYPIWWRAPNNEYQFSGVLHYESAPPVSGGVDVSGASYRKQATRPQTGKKVHRPTSPSSEACLSLSDNPAALEPYEGGSSMPVQATRNPMVWTVLGRQDGGTLVGLQCQDRNGTVVPTTNNDPSFACPLPQMQYCWGFNNHSMTYPPIPYVFTSQYNDDPWVIRVSMGDVFDVYFFNPTMMYHPMHLHGGTFWVRYAKPFACSKPLAGDFISSPLEMDNFALPPMGWTVLRVSVVSEGSWIFHCHIEWHLASGMNLIFQAGNGPPELPPDFPRCGNFPPSQQ